MIRFRMATLDDIVLLQKLNNEVFIDNSKYDDDLDIDWAMSERGLKYFSELVGSTENLCVIAYDSEIPVGYIAAGPKNIEYRKSRYCEIENMGVIPEYRAQGIGKLLIEKCIEWAKVSKYQKIFVNSYIANTKAVGFYKRLGFSEIDMSLEMGI